MRPCKEEHKVFTVLLPTFTHPPVLAKPGYNTGVVHNSSIGYKMKDVFSVLMAIVIALAAIFGISYGGYALYEFFAPRYTAVDNKVFKESAQYNDGMVRDLENLKMEYVNADKDHKDAVRAVVLHRFSVYPVDKMPPDLRNFYQHLQSGN